MLFFFSAFSLFSPSVWRHLSVVADFSRTGGRGVRIARVERKWALKKKKPKKSIIPGWFEKFGRSSRWYLEQGRRNLKITDVLSEKWDHTYVCMYGIQGYKKLPVNIPIYHWFINKLDTLDSSLIFLGHWNTINRVCRSTAVVGKFIRQVWTLQCLKKYWEPNLSINLVNLYNF